MSTDYRLQLLFLSLLREMNEKLDLVLKENAKLKRIGEEIMSTGVTAAQALSDIQAQVAAQTTVEQSAITLIQALSDQLTAAAGVSPAAVEAVVAQFQAQAQALAAAVTANTPSSTAPPQVGTSTPTQA